MLTHEPHAGIQALASKPTATCGDTKTSRIATERAKRASAALGPILANRLAAVCAYRCANNISTCCVHGAGVHIHSKRILTIGSMRISEWRTRGRACSSPKRGRPLGFLRQMRRCRLDYDPGVSTFQNDPNSEKEGEGDLLTGDGERLNDVRETYGPFHAYCCSRTPAVSSSAARL